MSDFSLDNVLDLEEEFYTEGFKEGHEKSAKEQYIEGKIYGLQTGFQRFLVVGYLEGLVSFWRQLPNLASVTSHIDQLEKILAAIPKTNDDDAVAVYEKSVLSARNKARVIAALTKTTDKLDKLDLLVGRVGGSLQVSEDLNDMW